MLIKKSKYLPEGANVILISLLYIICSIQYSPLCESLCYDAEVFRYMGMLIANGGAPYLDAFDHKPPLIYLINFIGFIITPNNSWGTFLLLNFMGLYSTILIYNMSKKITGSSKFSLVVTFIYVGLIIYPYLLISYNLTRQITVYLVVYLFSIIFMCKKRKIKLFSLGLIFTLIFLTQQNEILATIPLIVFVIFNDFNFKNLKFKSLITESMIFLAGIVVILLLLVSVILYWGNINEFIYQSFTFNTNGYFQKKAYFWLILRTINTAIFRKNLFPLAILLGLAFGFNLWKIKNISKTRFLIILSLFFQLLSTSLSGWAIAHYYLMFVPYLILLLIFTYKDFCLQLRFILSQYVLIPISVIILSVNVYFIFVSKPYNKNNAIAIEIAKKERKKGQFYTFSPSYLRLNYDLNIISPSKWIYSHFAYKDYDPKGKIIDSILSDLESFKTEYIIATGLIHEKEKQYIKKHYSAILTQDDAILYIRNKDVEK